MRVLEIARQFYPKVGGIESCVLNLSRGLIERGHTVEVLTLNRDLQTGGRLDSPPEIDGVAVHRIPYFGQRRYPVAPSWFRFAGDFEVIHIHAIDFFVDSAALARRLGILRKPVVVTTHGGIFHTAAWPRLKDLYWNNVLRRSVEEVSTVVAVSERDAQFFGSIVPGDKLVTIPNGIDPIFRRAGLEVRHAASRAAPRREIVSFGRVNSSKSIDRIIDLFAAVAPEFPNLDLVVAGPEEKQTSEILRRKSAGLGLANRIRFVGALPAEDLASLVAAADLFISAAPHEGFGITTVEALSAGVPVMVTRTGVHDQVVKSGSNGWFWSGKADSEAVAILRDGLLLPYERLVEMRNSARESAVPFDWSLTTDKYERVLESACRENPG
jgi:alpha-1,3-mannosyltransferase